MRNASFLGQDVLEADRYFLCISENAQPLQTAKLPSNTSYLCCLYSPRSCHLVRKLQCHSRTDAQHNFRNSKSSGDDSIDSTGLDLGMSCYFLPIGTTSDEVVHEMSYAAFRVLGTNAAYVPRKSHIGPQ